jgi:hypothetical protein
MGQDERLQAIHDAVMEMYREVGVLGEKVDQLSIKVTALEVTAKPVTWATQTGSVLLWVCALLGGIGTAVKFFSGKF